MVEVRRAQVDDAAEIAAVHIASWEGAYRGVVPEAWFENRTLERITETWRTLLPDPERAVVWVASEADGEIIGFCGWALPSRDADAGAQTAELTSMYVEPGRWHLGAGRALMDAAIASLRDGDWGELTLWVLQDNPRARGFYEACGFVGDGSRQSAGPGGPDEIRMRRSV